MTNKPEPEFEVGNEVLVGSKQTKAKILDRKFLRDAGWFYQTTGNNPDKWKNGILIDKVDK